MHSRRDGILVIFPGTVSTPALLFHSINQEGQMVVEMIGFGFTGDLFKEADRIRLRDIDLDKH